MTKMFMLKTESEASLPDRKLVFAARTHLIRFFPLTSVEKIHANALKH